MYGIVGNLVPGLICSTLLSTVLKLTEFINVSWVWVLAPIWGPVAVVLILTLIFMWVNR
jgi:hypothetical protein